MNTKHYNSENEEENEEKDPQDIYSFENVSNVCYLITASQILFTNKTFSDIIRKYRNENNILLETKNLIDSEVVFQNKDYRCHKIRNLYSLKKELSVINKFFKSNEQQDTQECLLHLIDEYSKIVKGKTGLKRRLGYHELYSQEFYNNYSKCLDEYDNKNSPSPIRDIFKGVFRTTKICESCKTKSYNFEVFNQVYIVPTGQESLFTLFRKQFDLEEMNVRCDHCTKNKTLNKIFKKELTFMTFPESLVFCLKRYDENSFNASIPIEKQLIFNLNNRKFSYSLKLIVHHKGSDIHSGHYFITIDNLLINDSKINIINENSTLLDSNTAYIIVYDLISIEE